MYGLPGPTWVIDLKLLSKVTFAGSKATLIWMSQIFTEIKKKPKQNKSQQAILPGYPAKAATLHLLIHLLWKYLSHRSPLDQSYKLLPSLKKKKKKN